MEPTETPEAADEPSRVLRGIAALRAAPVAKRRAYAAIGAGLATAALVAAILAFGNFRKTGEVGVWRAGLAQLVGAFDGLVQSAKLKSEL